MANRKYGIFESTNIRGKLISMVSDIDLENGMLVHRGDLAEGVPGNEVYRAVIPTAASIAANEPVYIVGNPAWSYDTSSRTNQNEENYFIPAGTNFRTYEIRRGDKFGIADYGINGEPVAAGSFVVLEADSAKPRAVDTAPATGFAGKVVQIVDMGHEYWVGQATIDQRMRKVRIEILRNG